jgi:glycosyltransferase involved in cell wall biosynthesis
MYKWVTFKELRGLSRKQFAEELGKSCLAIWIDDSSGFGTFPIEAMHCNTPVIGKIPNMVPEWMETVDEQNNPIIKNNGVWTNTTLNIPELISTYVKVWFEDSVPEDLLTSMKESTGRYSTERQKLIIENVYGRMIDERKEEFNNILKVQTNITEAKQ